MPDLIFDGTCSGAGNIFAGDFDGDGYDTIGCQYDPCGLGCSPRGIFYRGRHTATVNEYFSPFYTIDDDDVTLFAGDWDGDGDDTPGAYHEPNNRFEMWNSFNTEADPMLSTVGDRTDIPLVGDWNGDGKDSLGVYRPSNRTFYLRNQLASGPVDYSIQYGNPSDVPVIGDWNEDGIDTIGLYRPSNQTWYLNNSLNSGSAAYVFPYGNVGGLVPIVGDWNASGTDTPGFAQN
jgi:uncharacterized protein YutD